MSNTINIGTRRSKLALWQAYYVQDLLEKAGLDTNIVEIETKGDKILDVSIAKIGSKGVFTEEIEEQLRNGAIDIAVHSAKDMQSELPQEFELIAFTEREQINDVVVSRDKNLRLGDSSRSITVGSSSVRRRAMLKAYYPHVKVVEMRGNLQTRIRKMDDGDCDAILLAYAGVHRMGYNDLIAEVLDENHFIPPVGQGCVAIEVCTSLDTQKRDLIRSAVNDPATEYLLNAERGFLKTLKGGCSIPAFCTANYTDAGEIKVHGGIISLDGEQKIFNELHAPKEDATALGHRLAQMTLDQGGAQILAQIHAQRDADAE